MNITVHLEMWDKKSFLTLNLNSVYCMLLLDSFDIFFFFVQWREKLSVEQYTNLSF